MSQKYYIASCVFTATYPQLSVKIQKYVHDRFQAQIVRCCIPKYKLEEFEHKMPLKYQPQWHKLPDSGDFVPGDTVISLCHNCSAIIEETKPAINNISLWEIILSDDQFIYPDYHHETMTLQDCWRAKERRTEQEAVREILKKMNIDVIELSDRLDQTNFCGKSLYRLAPVRNLKLAPKRFVKNAQDKFQDLAEEEQNKIMQNYCKQFKTQQVAAYCHYCIEGLTSGGKKAVHLASLLFETERFQSSCAKRNDTSPQTSQ